MTDITSKLSKLQRHVLAWLHAEHLAGGAGPGYAGCIWWRTGDIIEWVAMGCPRREVFEAAMQGVRR